MESIIISTDEIKSMHVREAMNELEKATGDLKERITTICNRHDSVIGDTIEAIAFHLVMLNTDYISE